jgi:hypothetical protein
MPNRFKLLIQEAWQGNAPLTATTILMLVLLFVSGVGLIVDDRIITGAPAWLKPAKFAVSTGIYSGTMAWVFGYLTIWPRLMRAVAWLMSLSLVIEVVIIDIQAARGTTSHFNVGTLLDATLFSIMGAFIGLLLLTSVVVLVALFRQSFFNSAWGWALRCGMLVTVIGSAAGGMMLRASADQLDQMRITHRPQILGAHTVGGADGSPGLPGVAWSRSHGDLRIPHFFGLHGIQIIPFLAFLLGRTRLSRRRQTDLILAAAASYLALVVILTWQALRGQSIVQPDAQMLEILAVWLATNAVVVAVLWRRSPTLSSVNASTAGL